MKNMEKKLIAQNKKAYHDYFVEETFQAGMVLTGTEIKSIRKGKIQLKDSFCRIQQGEVFLWNCHIAAYEQGNRYNHEPERIRKLLLTKKEIAKLIGKTKETGYALVPINVFIQNGYAKIEIALAKGKKNYDKRETLKKKEVVVCYF